MAKFKTQCSQGPHASRFILLAYLDYGNYNIETNKTPVTYSLYIAGGNFDGDNFNPYGSQFYGYDCYGTINIFNHKTGVKLSTVNGHSTAMVNNTSSALIGSGSFDAPHNDDGTLTLRIDGLYSGGHPQQATGGSIIGLLNLPTIPRASKITSGSGNIGGITTINISRASANFTHTVNYAFGNLTGTVGTNIANSIDWRIPTTFYAQIPNSPTGNGTLTCITYSGNTEIGRSNFGFNASCIESECRPNLSIAISDDNPNTVALTKDGSGKVVIVNYASILKFDFTYSAKNSATISYIAYNGVSLGTSTSTSFAPQNVNLDFNFTVVDTRGFANTVICQCKDANAPNYFKLLPYIPLTVFPTTKRSNQTSDDMNVLLSGNYFNGNFKTGTPNTLALKWEIREKAETGGWSVWKTGVTTLTPKIVGTDITTYEISPPVLLVNPHQVDGKFNYKNMYEIKYIANDLLNTTVGINAITRGIPNFELYEHGIFMNGLLLFKI